MKITKTSRWHFNPINKRKQKFDNHCNKLFEKGETEAEGNEVVKKLYCKISKFEMVRRKHLSLAM